MTSSFRFLLILTFIAAAATAGCRQAPASREYPLRGQIVAVNRETRQLTIRHEDIPGYMPGMVMSFTPADPGEIDRRRAGELVTATLVVRDLDSSLKDIRVTGTAPVDPQVARNATVPVLAAGDAVPEGDFQDQDGRASHLSQWRGSVVVLTFIYTRCPLPDFCPRMERNFLSLQKQLRESGLAEHVTLLAVSFDPSYDTPQVLKKRATAIGADAALWRYLTGDVNTIERFAAQFGVTVIRNPADPRDITHNLRTAIVDPGGRLVDVLSGNQWTPDDVLAVIRKVYPATTT